LNSDLKGYKPMYFKTEEEISAYFSENPNLRYLALSGCPPEITGLPQLPSSLTALRLGHLPNITNFPELPSSFRFLEVKNSLGVTRG